MDWLEFVDLATFAAAIWWLRGWTARKEAEAETAERSRRLLWREVRALRRWKVDLERVLAHTEGAPDGDDAD